MLLLHQFDIADVEVEFRSSIYTRSDGPSLLKTVSDLHPTVDIRGALTPVLGLSIAAQGTLHVEGTGGLYLSEGGGSQKVLLVTARHVLFPPKEGFHLPYADTNTSAPRRNVILLGSRAFDELLKSIEISISDKRHMVGLYELRIRKLQGTVVDEDQGQDNSEEVAMELQENQALLSKASKAIEALRNFSDEVKADWNQAKQRVIGHVVHSPPITFAAGTEGFTEDYAIVEVDSTKFNKAFKGNVMDLGAS